MFAISHNIPEIRDRLRRIKTLLGTPPTWQDDMVEVAEKALENLKLVTPKSDGGKKHVADGWALRKVGGGGKDRIPLLWYVWNKRTHDITEGGTVPKEKAKLKLADGTQKPYTLLEVLEYGSPSHRIDPVNAKRLHFISKEGDEVFTLRVHHPGTRPYGMLRTTRAKVEVWLKKFTDKWARRIVNEWGKEK